VIEYQHMMFVLSREHCNFSSREGREKGGETGDVSSTQGSTRGGDSTAILALKKRLRACLAIYNLPKYGWMEYG